MQVERITGIFSNVVVTCVLLGCLGWWSCWWLSQYKGLLLLKREMALLLLILSPPVLSDCLDIAFLADCYAHLFPDPKEDSQLFWLGVCSVGFVHRGVLWEPEPAQVSGSSACLEEGVKPLHFWQWWAVNLPFCILWNCILHSGVLTVQWNSCALLHCKPWCSMFSFLRWVRISSYQIMISKLTSALQLLWGVPLRGQTQALVISTWGLQSTSTPGLLLPRDLETTAVCSQCCDLPLLISH